MHVKHATDATHAVTFTWVRGGVERSEMVRQHVSDIPQYVRDVYATTHQVLLDIGRDGRDTVVLRTDDILEIRFTKLSSL
jgi:hypothetical protein